MTTALRWDAETLWERLVAQLPGITVEVLAQIDSTNTELMRRARAGQQDAVLLVAQTQTAGRGRMGRQWLSDAPEPGASLTFSLGLPLQPQDWSGLSLAVGLALVQALHPQLQLKWPNDLWWQQRKLGGILVETAMAGSARYCVVGVGLNIRARDGQGLRTPPAALAELRPELDAPAALACVAPALLRALLSFERQGFAPLRTAFDARDALRGLEVVCSDGLQGLALGVDESGAMLVHTAAGPRAVHSAEVSVRPVVSGLPGADRAFTE